MNFLTKPVWKVKLYYFMGNQTTVSDLKVFRNELLYIPTSASLPPSWN